MNVTIWPEQLVEGINAFVNFVQLIENSSVLGCLKAET